MSCRPQTRASSTVEFGISDGSLLWSNTLNADLADIRSMGFKWLRVDIDWEYLQPTPTVYRWEIFDNFVTKANSHGLKIVFILDYSAPWAYQPGCTGDTTCKPDVEKFATYAGKVTRRYAPRGVHTYEVWNEPNIETFWKPATSAADYTILLKAAYPAIKAADPKSTVLSGGLAPIAAYDVSDDIPAVAFLEGMYDNGARNYFDALSFHPYSYPTRPNDTEDWNGWSILKDLTPSIRSTMSANGDSAKKVWITEFGAPTNGPGAIATCSDYNYDDSPDHVDECLQGDILTQGIAIPKKYKWMGPTFVYSYRDVGTTPDTNENFFGVLRNNGTRKAAYNRVKAAIAAQ